ncbi:MAG: class I SAM-dependent methyltransferase [Cyclobacteriaceae bacterium]
MEQKISITKGSVQETLLLPLWGRAYETQQKEPRLIDNKAVEIVGKVDYDFSTIHETQAMSQHAWVARSLHTDKLALEFIKKHPKATIVNLGCGLDTTFSRIDNGEITFYELDFSDVIELRKHFYKDSERHISIASSFHDKDAWFDKIKVEDGLLFLAGGVFVYSTEEQMKKFFTAAADYFKNCEFYFDAMSPLGVKIGKKMVLKKGGMDFFKDSEGWALKPVKSLEKWSRRFKVISATPMYKGMNKGLPLKMKFVSFITNILKVAPMVHLRIKTTG